MRAPWISDLAQYCLVCGRWHASPHTIKIHMRHIPNLFLYSEQATRIATRVAGPSLPASIVHSPELTPDTSPLASRFGKLVCSLSFTAMDQSGRCVHGGVVRASLGQAPDPINVATQGRDPRKAGQSRQAQCRRQGTGSGQSGPRIQGAQSTLSGLWRGIRPAAAGKPEAGHSILMHQQESISTLRLSTGWVWWLRIPEPSPIAMMIQAAQVWREEVVKPDSPRRETPIRQAIFWSLIQ